MVYIIKIRYFLLLPLFISMLSISAFSTGWVVETLDTAYYVGDIRIDPQDRPHLSYSTMSGVKYAYKDGAAWTKQMVMANSADGSSIALDSSGKAHFACGGFGSVLYLTPEAGSWRMITVETSSGIGQSPSLALDNKGKPHICYDDRTNPLIYILKYASWEGSGWDISIIDNDETNIGGHIAVDSANKPHVSYFAQTYYNVKYATRSGSTWLKETVDGATTNVGWDNNLALMSTTRPQIVYTDNSWQYLRWASKASGVWSIGVAQTGGGFGYCSIALNKTTNLPHLCYAQNGVLKYTKYDGSSWSAPQVIDPAIGAQPAYNSIALDSAGNPRVCYKDTVLNKVKYAFWDAVPPYVATSEPVDRSVGVSPDKNIVITFSEPMDTSSVITTIYPPATLSEGWNASSTEVTYDPAGFLSPNVKYLVTVEGSARDLAGNTMGTARTLSFSASIESAELTTEVTVNGRRFLSGDIIPPNKLNSVELRILSPYPLAGCDLFVDSVPVVMTTIPSPPQYLCVGNFAIAPLPNDPTHLLTIYISNEVGTEKLITLEAIVLPGSAQVVEMPLNYPNPFSPLSSDPSKNVTRIQYKLSNDANIKIQMFNVVGEKVKEWKFSSGASGGKAGLNSITWNGKDMLDRVVGNGMFVYVILANDRKVGSGKLVVLDRK